MWSTSVFANCAAIPFDALKTALTGALFQNFPGGSVGEILILSITALFFMPGGLHLNQTKGTPTPIGMRGPFALRRFEISCQSLKFLL